MTNQESFQNYEKYYDEEKLLSKLKTMVFKLGEEVVLRILMLYYLLGSGKVPLKIRVLIVAALGYFVLPADLISDFIPALGFSDDIAFLTYAFNQASHYADEAIKKKAEQKLKSWRSGKEKKANATDAPALL
jgi:uncharacterized membrane protein YkvA (DUF1232 family)